jgi:DNA-binding transcriptional MerR regulator
MPAKKVDKKARKSAIIARYGVSFKALRVYEEAEILVPPRNPKGTRMYGEAEVTRLSAALALKQMGLPLVRIAALLNARPAKIVALLDAEALALENKARHAKVAADLLRGVRNDLSGRNRATAKGLATELRRIRATIMQVAPELQTLADEYFTPQQLNKLDEARFSPQNLIPVSEAWSRIHDDVAAMAPGGDPASEEARAVAIRADALIQRLCGDDEALKQRIHEFWSAALRNPRTASLLPLTVAQWKFLNEARAFLLRDGARASRKKRRRSTRSRHQSTASP